MFTRDAHYALKTTPWDPDVALQTMHDISSDAVTRLRSTGKLPRHPMDDFEVGSELWCGAVGAFWALQHLAEVGAIELELDLTPLLEHQLSANRDRIKKTPYPDGASYLVGELPILMLLFKRTRGTDVADQIFKSVEKNNDQPVRELMWGIPGSMLCSNFMHRWTGEERWREIFLLQSRRLLNDWQEVDTVGHLWAQDLYRRVRKLLGLVHGFAGNMVPLIEGRELLGAEQYDQICSRARRAIVNTVESNESHANWPGAFDESKRKQTVAAVQICHGAPGIVTDLGKMSSNGDTGFDQLLEKAGELVWYAGPLKKGANLCHGTAGNGYAFLKLYQRTGNEMWLDRARAFAMSAIEQVQLAEKLYRQRRCALWTGDLGTAVYLWNCLQGQAQFPTIDAF